MRPLFAKHPGRAIPRRGGGAGILITVVVLALVTGLSIAVLPLQLTTLLTGSFVLLLALAVMAAAPPMHRVPASSLAWGLVIAVAFYFIWPRNVFIPVQGLPVKHPQRLFYLMFLAYAFYVMVKCAPARAQMMRALKSMPWMSTLWLLFALWQVVSLLAAKHSLSLVGGWMVDTLVITVLYPMALLCLTTQRDYYRLFGALLLAALVNCLFAIPESILQRNLFERFIVLDALDPETAKQIIAAKVRGGQFRAQGAFDHPLLLAEFLAVNLPFAMMLMFQRGRRMLGAATVSLLVVGLYLSHSRVALVASLLAISAMVMVLILRGAGQGRRNPWPLVGALFAVPLAVAGGVAATAVIRGVTAGATYVEASSTEARWQMFYAGLRLIQEQPLFGYGPGTAGFVLNFQNTFGVMTLDNYLLAVALNFGLPGLVLYLSVLLLAGWRALTLAIGADEPLVQRLAWAIFGALLAFGPIKLVLGTSLNNLLLPIMMASLAFLTLSYTPSKLSMTTAPLRRHA